MRTINTYFGDIDISYDTLQQKIENKLRYSNARNISAAEALVIEDMVMELRHAQDLIESKGCQRPNSIKTLIAHGYKSESYDPEDFIYRALYADGNQKGEKVMDWIRDNDAAYEALFLQVCNNGKFQPSSDNAHLIYSKQKSRPEEISLASMINIDNVVLYTPEKHKIKIEQRNNSLYIR